MILADTSFIIDLINSDSAAIQKAKMIDAEQIPVGLSAISVEEYLRGVFYLFSKDPGTLERKLTQAESDLARFQIIDFDYKLAKFAARIDAELTIKGQMIGFADVIIGATALFHNYRILTRNVRHFSRIQNLVIEEY